MERKSHIVGFHEGALDIPVDVETYLFSKDFDVSSARVKPFPSDVDNLISNWLDCHCNVSTESGQCYNQNDYTDIEHYVGDPLIVYINDMNIDYIYIVNLVRNCAYSGVPLTVYYWTGASYVEQEIFW